MSRRTALLLVGGLLASAALVVLTTVGGRPASDGSPEGYRLPRPAERAAPSAVRPVHQALHTLGKVCTGDADPTQATAVGPAVDVILRFARRNPDVRFPIHDEVGTVPSLLFVARDSVRQCAPQFIGRIDRLIPAEYRPGAVG